MAQCGFQASVLEQNMTNSWAFVSLTNIRRVPFFKHRLMAQDNCMANQKTDLILLTVALTATYTEPFGLTPRCRAVPAKGLDFRSEFEL